MRGTEIAFSISEYESYMVEG